MPADPEGPAGLIPTGSLAAVQGGLLLTQVRRDVTPSATALDAALPHRLVLTGTARISLRTEHSARGMTDLGRERVTAMATFTRSEELRGAEFIGSDLSGARFVRADLTGVVMRAVDVAGADIDAPWLFDGESFLRVNGVDVIPLVDAELNRRFPGRADRRAADPDGLRAAWAVLQRTWAATLARVAAMPADTVDVSVESEWSFALTLRHLVMATDTWLGRAILESEQPYHPIGQPNAEFETEGNDMSIFTTVTPSYAEVLEGRAGRVAMVRDFLATVTSDELAATRTNPWNPAYQETTRSCLHVILGEEWEHHRYAVRDLDAIEAASDA